MSLRDDLQEALDADAGASADLGAILDDGGRMDVGLGHQLLMIMALISASATRVPATFASPRYHQMFRRWLSFRM